MAITDQDRDSIELIATRVGETFHASQMEMVEKMLDGQMTAVQRMIEHHQTACPHGRRLLQSRFFLAGAIAGLLLVTAGGSALGSVLLKLLAGI